MTKQVMSSGGPCGMAAHDSRVKAEHLDAAKHNDEQAVSNQMRI